MRLPRFLVVLCLLLPAGAWAQASGPSDDVKAQASAHFRRGVELFQEQAYRASLAEFQRAYGIAPDYRLLFNIAQAKLELHDYLGAAESYERYLVDGGSEVPPARRTEVEDALSALRERVATVEIVVNRADAEVLVDDIKVGTSPLKESVRVNVGGHRISARTAYGATDTEVIDVAGGDHEKVRLELAPPAAAAPAVASAPVKKPWNAAEKAAVATWSLGGALGVGAVTTALLASAGQKDLDELLETRDVSASEIDRQREKTHRLAITTDVLTGTAVAAVVAGTLAWVFGHDKGEKREPSRQAARVELNVSAGLGSLDLSGRF
jgi:tetratricopeptide (TPR) repeat protein